MVKRRITPAILLTTHITDEEFEAWLSGYLDIQKPERRKKYVE